MIMKKPFEWLRGEEIACGRFASVSEAVVAEPPRADLPRLLAVKTCSASLWDSIREEKRILDAIGPCPRIVRCFGDSITVESDQRLYNVLFEFASRGTLGDEIVRQSGPGLAESDVRRHARSILEGLSAIHGTGFVHCDIKPQNILLFRGDEAKIAGLGAAKEKRAKVGRCQPRGTPLYMAPETFNANVYEPPCDVWALGCTVLEMALGKTTWEEAKSKNISALFMRIGEGDDVTNILGAMSEDGIDFLRKCFVDDPKARWTVQMLLNHAFVTLGAVLRGDGGPAFAEKRIQLRQISTLALESWRHIASNS